MPTLFRSLSNLETPVYDALMAARAVSLVADAVFSDSRVCHNPAINADVHHIHPDSLAALQWLVSLAETKAVQLTDAFYASFPDPKEAA